MCSERGGFGPFACGICKIGLFRTNTPKKTAIRVFARKPNCPLMFGVATGELSSLGDDYAIDKKALNSRFDPLNTQCDFFPVKNRPVEIG